MWEVEGGLVVVGGGRLVEVKDGCLVAAGGGRLEIRKSNRRLRGCKMSESDTVLPQCRIVKSQIFS